MKHYILTFLAVAVLVASYGAADDEAYSCTVYTFVREEKTRDEAMIHCYEDGEGSLVMINNQDEQDKVNALLDAVQPDKDVWTDGIRDECLTCFIWQSTGTEVPYTNWKQGEPNNFEDDDESCMEMLKDHGYEWNDVNCYQKRQFVCQKHTWEA